MNQNTLTIGTIIDIFSSSYILDTQELTNEMFIMSIIWSYREISSSDTCSSLDSSKEVILLLSKLFPPKLCNLLLCDTLSNLLPNPEPGKGRERGRGWGYWLCYLSTDIPSFHFRLLHLLGRSIVNFPLLSMSSQKRRVSRYKNQSHDELIPQPTPKSCWSNLIFQLTGRLAIQSHFFLVFTTLFFIERPG